MKLPSYLKGAAAVLVSFAIGMGAGKQTANHKPIVIRHESGECLKATIKRLLHQVIPKSSPLPQSRRQP